MRGVEEGGMGYVQQVSYRGSFLGFCNVRLPSGSAVLTMSYLVLSLCDL